MNKRRIWLVIPVALLPYTALFTLAVIFFATSHPLCRFIMERVFGGNGPLLVALLLLFCLLAAVCSVIWLIISIRNQWNALSLAKTAMVVKLLQVPAYVLIFILGVILATTMLALPFSLGLFLLDCLTLWLTGLLTVAAVINAVRQNMVSWKECVWIVILQLVFCADVVASILFFSKLQKKQRLE